MVWCLSNSIGTTLYTVVATLLSPSIWAPILQTETFDIDKARTSDDNMEKGKELMLYNDHFHTSFIFSFFIHHYKAVRSNVLEWAEKIEK